MNRLTTLTNTLGSTTLSNYVYGYDADGHKTSAVETVTGVGTTSYSYAYNAIGELTYESASGAGENYNYWYGYDAAGNQIFKSSDNPTGTAFMTGDGNTTINLYDIDNRMTQSFNDAVTAVASATAPSSPVYTETTNSYDNNGSLFESDVTSTTETLMSNGFGGYFYSNHGSTTDNSYNYDIRNRMNSFSSNGSATSGATYTYNDAGERVSEVGTLTDGTNVNVTYLYDTQNPTGYDQILEERSSGTATSSFIIGLGNVGQTTSGSSNAIIYLLKDGHGYTRLLTNSSGAVQATSNYDFDAFGNPLNFGPGTSVTALTDHLTPDGIYDFVTGLERDGVRDRQGAEFYEQDSYGFGQNTDPLSLNLMTYADGDPVNGTDPTGHEDIGELLITIGIGLTIFDLSYHLVSGISHFANGQTNAGNQDMVWAMIDLLTLGLPIGPASGPVLEAAESAISMSRADVPAAAIWGYLTTLLSVANSGGGGGGGGGSSSSGGGGGGNTGSSSGSQGPGQWVPENQSGWKDPAVFYQAQITGHPGEAYLLNDVEYDGWDGTNLLDAKGPGYSNFLDQNGNWKGWFQESGGMQDLIDEAESQVRSSGGNPVVWHVAEQDAATAMQKLVGPMGVQVIYTPPQ